MLTLDHLPAEKPVLEVLATHHDRADFDCGEASLNLFLQRQARQNASRNLGVTRVVVPVAGDARILAYYTLVTRSVTRDELPKFNRFPPDGVGVVLLGRLAVDKRAQGQRLGTLMVVKAIEQTERAAQDVGHPCADRFTRSMRKAKQWYLGLDFGFEELKTNTLHLYLPIENHSPIGINNTRNDLNTNQHLYSRR